MKKKYMRIIRKQQSLQKNNLKKETEELTIEEKLKETQEIGRAHV